MFITPDVLFSELSKVYQIERYGRTDYREELSVPEFYIRGAATKRGHVYIARARDLSRSPSKPCLFIVSGILPNWIPYDFESVYFYIRDEETDLLSLFNWVQEYFDRINTWGMAMEKLLNSHAGVEEFVRVSIPVFKKGIVITDYNLTNIVDCIELMEDDHSRIVIRPEIRRIPDEVSSKFKDMYRDFISRREPFHYTGQAYRNPMGDNYCINLYSGNTYYGCCTLWEGVYPIEESDMILFGIFSDYIKRCLAARSLSAGSEIMTWKTLFSEILRNHPISREELTEARRSLEENMLQQGQRPGCWRCFVIISSNKKKTLPESYLCSALEDRLPNCITIPVEGKIVCYSMFSEGDSVESITEKSLLPYLKDMNFKAAVSTSFEDEFRARDYYLAALRILETGRRKNPAGYIYRFEDYILDYILHHATGNLDADIVCHTGLIQLRNLSEHVNYIETLRVYLDLECNVSRTADALYIHRSTCIQRLDKIREYVDFHTPEQKLYLRICIRIMEHM